MLVSSSIEYVNLQYSATSLARMRNNSQAMNMESQKFHGCHQNRFLSTFPSMI